MPTSLTRADLAKFITDPKSLRAFEELFVGLADVSDAVEGQVGATGAIQQASVVTLSANAAFSNERVLTQGAGITLTITDDKVTISSANKISTNGGFRLTLNLLADSNIDLPVSGKLGLADPGGPYANDAAAAAAGIAVGEIYRAPAGVVSWRQA